MPTDPYSNVLARMANKAQTANQAQTTNMPMPTVSYGNPLAEQARQFIERNRGFLAPGDAEKYQASIGNLINSGADPAAIQSAMAQLQRAEEYKNQRIAQGYDPAAASAVSANFSQALNSIGNISSAAQQARQANVPMDQITGLLGDVNTPTGKQALNEVMARQAQLDQQNKMLEDFRNQRATQYFGSPNATLSEALSGGKGDLADLNSFLGKQQSATFNQELRPLINMQMGGQGLQDSGANIELQAKALGQLERARQQNMMQAALGARQQIAGLGREDILGDVGARQQSLTDAFGLQRAGITMQFQQQLEDQRAQLARELSSRNGAQQGGLGNILTGGLMGAGMGFMAGGPYGGLMGAGIGAYGGSQSYNNAGAMQSGMMGGQAGGFFRNDTSIRQPQWTNPSSTYRGPGNTNGYPWLGNGGY